MITLKKLREELMYRFTGSIVVFALLAAASTEAAVQADSPERTRITSSCDQDLALSKGRRTG
jgi:hypothetical protein